MEKQHLASLSRTEDLEHSEPTDVDRLLGLRPPELSEFEDSNAAASSFARPEVVGCMLNWWAPDGSQFIFSDRPAFWKDRPIAANKTQGDLEMGII